MKPLPYIDIVLSVFNQENLIERVLFGIFKNTTTPFTLIMVFDGCTDRTEPRALKYIKRHKPALMKNLITTTAPNVYETRANNIGFKLATSDYMITLQDDMVVQEYGWERRLTFPLRKFNDVLAVTSRVSQNIERIDTTNQYYSDKAGREFKTLDRNTFAVRDVINRGPVAFDMKHLRSMNFLNEAYAPSDLDDADLSLRAWEQHKLRVGAYWIDYLSPTHWGNARSPLSTMVVGKRIIENGLRLLRDHKQYLESGVKHTENILIPETEVDYTSQGPSFFYALARPYRINKKDVRHMLDSAKNGIKECVMRILEALGRKDVRDVGIKKALIGK